MSNAYTMQHFMKNNYELFNCGRILSDLQTKCGVEIYIFRLGCDGLAILYETCYITTNHSEIQISISIIIICIIKFGLSRIKQIWICVWYWASFENKYLTKIGNYVSITYLFKTLKMYPKVNETGVINLLYFLNRFVNKQTPSVLRFPA